MQKARKLEELATPKNFPRPRGVATHNGEGEAQYREPHLPSLPRLLQDGAFTPPSDLDKVGRQSKRRKDTVVASNRDLSLTSLPEEIVSHILAYVKPKVEYRHWEWADTFGLTCKLFLKVARDLAPKSLELRHFRPYSRQGAYHGVDLRNNILVAFRTSSWKGSKLEELHVSWNSILNLTTTNNLKYNEEILEALKSLLCTAGVLPRLSWLDVNVTSDHILDYPLVDHHVLEPLPSSLPSLSKLCLAGCFKDGWNEVSTDQLKKCALGLSKLTSLSLAKVYWMSDEHVAALLPIVGGRLARLELIDCSVFHFDDETEDSWQKDLTDATMAVVAEQCQNLESFSISDTKITSAGLTSVLRANPKIGTLGISGGDGRKGLLQDAAIVVALHAPHLTTLRDYSGVKSWLNDEGLITIINAQMKASKENGIALQTLGVESNDLVTNRGLAYALERGVSTIEASDTPPGFHRSEKYRILQLSPMFPEARFVEGAYPFFVDGSLYSHHPGLWG